MNMVSHGGQCDHPEYNGCAAGGLFAGGSAFAAGGGVQGYVAPWLSLGGRALVRIMAFQHQDDAERTVRETNLITGLVLALDGTFHG